MQINKKERLTCHNVPQVIPAQIRQLNNLIVRRVNEQCRECNFNNITSMHCLIIGYLYMNKDIDIYQRDIEKQFTITRSTVTNILKLMEKKGYINREGVPKDARLKKIILTEKGNLYHKKILKILQMVNDQLDSILTEEERTEFLRILLKLKDGLIDMD